MRRLGVIGTMVWDRIHRAGAVTGPTEEWGGISYALAALEATLPDDWAFVPLVKVGDDLLQSANAFLNTLSKRAADRFVAVPEPNNRVVLRYESPQRRTEHLTGGVPPWRWEELEPNLHDLDAIYVNFISGFEFDLGCAEALRAAFPGPIYADLHSLLLGLTNQGDRYPQPLEDAGRWLACFDVVQVNEDEMNLLGGDTMQTAAAALFAGVRLLVVTLGAQGAVYFTSRPFAFAHRTGGGGGGGGPTETARISSLEPYGEGDATGCGDVFGATLLAGLLEERDLNDAIRAANRLAARNIEHRGATNLHFHLRGEIAPR